MANRSILVKYALNDNAFLTITPNPRFMRRQEKRVTRGLGACIKAVKNCFVEPNDVVTLLGRNFHLDYTVRLFNRDDWEAFVDLDYVSEGNDLATFTVPNYNGDLDRLQAIGQELVKLEIITSDHTQSNAVTLVFKANQPHIYKVEKNCFVEPNIVKTISGRDFHLNNKAKLYDTSGWVASVKLDDVSRQNDKATFTVPEYNGTLDRLKTVGQVPVKLVIETSVGTRSNEVILVYRSADGLRKSLAY